MSLQEKYGTTKKRAFEIDTTGYTFIKPKDLIKKGTRYVIDGLYINTKGKYGAQANAILIAEKLIVNLPNSLLETTGEIIKDQEAVKQIKDGKAGIELYEYTNSRGTFVGVSFVDIDLPF